MPFSKNRSRAWVELGPFSKIRARSLEKLTGPGRARAGPGLGPITNVKYLLSCCADFLFKLNFLYAMHIILRQTLHTHCRSCFYSLEKTQEILLNTRMFLLLVFLNRYLVLESIYGLPRHESEFLFCVLSLVLI